MSFASAMFAQGSAAVADEQARQALPEQNIVVQQDQPYPRMTVYFIHGSHVLFFRRVSKGSCSEMVGRIGRHAKPFDRKMEFPALKTQSPSIRPSAGSKDYLLTPGAIRKIGTLEARSMASLQLWRYIRNAGDALGRVANRSK